jgi:hypothetical protein
MMFRTVAVLILAVLTFPISAVPQKVEQAASMETCVANLNRWSSGLDGIPFGEQARSVVKLLTEREMSTRLEFLQDCESASLKQLKAAPIEQRPSLDKLGVLSGRMQHLTQIYMLESSTRYFNFVVRHKLLAQFDREDESGER